MNAEAAALKVSRRTQTLEKSSPALTVVTDNSLAQIVEGNTVDYVPVEQPDELKKALRVARKDQLILHKTIVRTVLNDLPVVDNVVELSKRARMEDIGEIPVDALRKSTVAEVIDIVEIIDRKNSENLPVSINDNNVEQDTFEAKSESAHVFFGTKKMEAPRDANLLNGEVDEDVNQSALILAPSKLKELKNVVRAIVIADKDSNLAELLNNVTPVKRLADHRTAEELKSLDDAA